jgi:hypothetical protein
MFLLQKSTTIHPFLYLFKRKSKETKRVKIPFPQLTFIVQTKTDPGRRP